MADSGVYVEAMIEFVRSLGLTVIERSLPDPTILPGLTISHGGIVVDRERLSYPGDLLHEAGHLAVKASSDRTAVDHSAGTDPAEEMMAMAWAWAAGRHLAIPADIVFHEAAYQGNDAGSLAEQFAEGGTFGVPMLQFFGMTAEPANADRLGREPFPAMTRWLR
jgi:hypothetical protein